MAQFFIHRPIFAWVIALVVMLAGVLSLTTMPVAQYPTIAPPVVTIAATYPGASAQTVENTVTQIIEQQIMVWMVYVISLQTVRVTVKHLLT